MRILDIYPCEGYGGVISAWIARAETNDGRILIPSSGRQDEPPTEAEWLEMALGWLEQEAQSQAATLEVEAEDGTIV